MCEARHFDSAQKFVDFLLTGEEFQPSLAFDTLLPGSAGHIFRGQWNSEWDLVPRALRVDGDSALIHFTPQAPKRGVHSTTQEKRQYLGDRIHSELDAVRRFLMVADGLGISTPIDFHHFKAHSSDIMKLWNEETDVYNLPFPDERLLPAFALAQHSGVPTRILDWTESPLVAAFFAAYEVSTATQGHSVEPGPAARIAVFSIYAGPGSEEEPYIVQVPQYINPFLRAQKGLFTISLRANHFFFDNDRWPSIEDLDLKNNVRKITLPQRCADDLLRILFKYDVTRHHLMPTLQSAAQSFDYNRALFGALNL